MATNSDAKPQTPPHRNAQEYQRNDGTTNQTPALTPASRRTSILTIPAPIKRVFDRFPLFTYPANELPLSCNRAHAQNVLYLYTTAEDAALGAPSFHPGCLKWQTLLRIYEIPFQTQPSTTHASPSTSLPFLLPATNTHAPKQQHQEASPQPLTIATLPSWIRQNSTLPAREPTNPLHESLLHPLRTAYTHALFLTPTAFARAASPRYIAPSTRARAVRAALAAQLRAAAFEDVTRASGAARPALDPRSIYGEAADALSALGAVLGEYRWFGWRRVGEVERRAAAEGDGPPVEDEEVPGLLDAAVFGYTHVILELLEGNVEGTAAVELVDALKAQDNLLRHRERILQEYYQ